MSVTYLRGEQRERVERFIGARLSDDDPAANAEAFVSALERHARTSDHIRYYGEQLAREAEEAESLLPMLRVAVDTLKAPHHEAPAPWWMASGTGGGQGNPAAPRAPMEDDPEFDRARRETREAVEKERGRRNEDPDKRDAGK